MQATDHPNIVKFFQVYSDSSYVHLVTEFCAGGEVIKHLLKQQGGYPEAQAALYFSQILAAVRMLHELGICHRDLKLENFLFTDPEKRSTVKMIDFGFSKKFGGQGKMHAVVGTPYYIAPEVIRGDYDYKCDVWSCGVILHMLLLGSAPFSDPSVDKIL